MNYKSKEFKELQAQWYQKLKESGFEDIENTDKGCLKMWSSTFQHEKTIHSSQAFHAKQAYFYEATHSSQQFLDCPLFFDPIDQRAWRYHCDGLSLREISLKLNQSGYKTNKDIVNKVINRCKRLFGLCG